MSPHYRDSVVTFDHGLDIGDIVHYYTYRTIGKPVPEKVGPRAAIVVRLNNDSTVDLTVFVETQRTYPAYSVTDKPTTPIKHYWAKKPVKETP